MKNYLKHLELKKILLSSIKPFNHPLTLNFPWSLGYMKKLAFGSSVGNYLLPVLCTAKEYQTCTDTPSQCTNSHI